MKKFNNDISKQLNSTVLRNQQGAIGYVLAWLMGVPAIVLVAIYLFTR